MRTFENRKSLFRNTLIAAALAAGIGASGTSFGDPAETAEPLPHSDSVGAVISDTAITDEVKARYLGDERLKTSQISVTTTNGVVTLSGTVGNAESKSAAVELAQGVEGVKSVDTSGLSLSGG
ncbi:MAG TPA: BON domain-containing protein [Steroidobacteraceae bacterium]